MIISSNHYIGLHAVPFTAHCLILPFATQVCDETQPWDGGLVALSCFGFGGANMHMVMEGRATERVQLLQTDSSSDSSIAEEPALSDNIIPLAARTSEGLAYLAKVINEVRLRHPVLGSGLSSPSCPNCRT